MLNKHECGLLLIDVQGNLAQCVANHDAVLKQIRIAVQAAHLFELPIIWVEHVPDKLGATADNVRRHLSGTPFAKRHFSAWQEPPIAAAIADSGRTHWLVCGMESHVYVYQTVRDVLGAGLHVELLSDAIASRSADNKAVGIHKMLALGAQLNSVETAFFELQAQAHGERLRAWLDLIR